MIQGVAASRSKGRDVEKITDLKLGKLAALACDEILRELVSSLCLDRY